MNLPQIIHQARKDANLSQDQIARHLGFAHRSNVHRLETGKLELKAKDLIKLATLLDIDLNALKTE